jgi:autotransporter translocation and assembly factor TamB
MAWGRRAVRALAILAVLLVGLTIAIAVVSQTAWFRERLRRLALRQAEAAIEGRLVIGALEGNLINGVTMRDVSVIQGDTTVVSVPRVQLVYGIGDLVSTGREVQQIVIDRPVINAVRTPQGWNVARILKPRPPADPNKPRATFTLPNVRVTDARVTVREVGVPQTQAIPRRIEGLTFEGAVASSPRELSVDVRRLTFRAGQPDLDLRSLVGRVVSVPTGWRFQSMAVRTGESAMTLDGTMTRVAAGDPWAYDMKVTGQPVSLPEIGRLVPAARFDLHPRLVVGVRGTLDALMLDLDITQSEAGRAKGQIALDTSAPTRGVKGRLAVVDVNLAPIVKSASAAGRITGDATFDLRFPSATSGFPVDGTFAFTGPRAEAYGYAATDVRATGALDGRRVKLDASAQAYGGRATTKGTIARAGQGQAELALDLTGRVNGVDLRRLPASLRVPALDTRLAGTYAVKGPLSVLVAEATLDESTVEGATVSDGTVGRFARRPGGFTFGATGEVAGLDLRRLGAALRVPTLTQERFAGVVNGSFDVDGDQRGRNGLRLGARGTLRDTTVLGGRLPEVAYDATLDGRRLDVTSKGRVEGFDLAALSGSPSLTGTLTGDIDTRVTLSDTSRVTLETIGVSGTVMLEQPTLLKVPFERVTADLTMESGVANVRSLDARGTGFTLTGRGTLGLGPSDASDFAYRLEATSLVEPAKVADLPITGAATAEGKVTGTRETFLVTGTVAGDQVAYADIGEVGTVTAQYAVRLPDFDAARVDVESSIDAQQVAVRGVTLPTVNGTVGYGNRTVRFDVDGSDAVRTLAAKGSVALEEGRQRLVLDEAAVSRNDVRWTLAPGTTARATITPQQATIGQLQLANGAQTITVEGTVGIPADAPSSLRLDAGQVDVSDVMTLADRTYDGDGVVTLAATVGGTRERPVADGTIEVTQGRVGKIDVQRLGGRVSFDGTLAIIDIELVKDQFARLTAKGVVPRTIVEERAPQHTSPTPDDRLDVAIVSTPIDLALAEGTTPYVTKIGGQAQVDVRLTGSGRDPHVEGAVFLTDGTFVVPETGVTYKNLDAILTFEEERVVISEMGIETDNADRLTVSGELGLSREQARTVSLKMQGRDFRVVDNELGVLDLHTDMTISGTLLAPVVEGSIEVSDGRLELDEILPRFVTTTYATQAEYQAIPTERMRGAIVPSVLGDDEAAPELKAGSNTFTIRTGEPPPVSSATPPPAQPTPSGVTPPPSPVGTPASGTQVSPGATPATAGGVSSATPGPAAPAQPGQATPAPAQTAPQEATAKPTGSFSDLAMNIQVRIPDNLVLRGDDIEAARASIGDLNATLGGDFRVAKAAGKPVVLLGNVNTVRGTYAYQGRQFDIARDGQIIFRGGQELDPRLDITAQRTIQGVEARVRIQGTARRPELSLSSDPPLDEGDILALIIFNQPLNQLGTGQQNSLAQRAGGIAAGFVVSPLAEALGSSLDLDQFEVETTDPTGRVNPAIVIGQQVTQDMFLRFRQQFGNQAVSQFLLEYRLADFMRLQGNVAEGDGLTAGNRSLTQRIERYGVDLVFYFSF